MNVNQSLTIAYNKPAILGECPLWNDKVKLLYWIDIVQGILHCLNPQTDKHQQWLMPKEIGCIGLSKSGSLLCVLSDCFMNFNPKTKQLTLVNYPNISSQTMFNDGHADSLGRFWVGTKDKEEKNAIAKIFCLTNEETFKPILSGFTVANGLVFSPDNRSIYICDSPKRKIYCYDFDAQAGTLANQKLFVQIAEDEGYPDGLSIDSEGYLWVAHYQGWRISRYSPLGELDKVIKMPVPCPTDCCFGGEDLETLFITSASRHLTGKQKLAAPYPDLSLHNLREFKDCQLFNSNKASCKPER